MSDTNETIDLTISIREISINTIEGGRVNVGIGIQSARRKREKFSVLTFRDQELKKEWGSAADG
ncbi:hypothetical protein [Sulfoacidibacillus thermotolerans]|uniref:Uncharacterized protein n=1 Tax=Sulfoacidibacillus thermotolerans TaxID=1765684 RepID=A0A2U3D900_SULT2|nr:hypothetical protein [Sulfoacidibacillus thermotolerans]PWI57760.1 hypothetical protein BM613_07205 [Sulfoacidibacillus thermotolerans]